MAAQSESSASPRPGRWLLLAAALTLLAALGVGVLVGVLLSSDDGDDVAAGVVTTTTTTVAPTTSAVLTVPEATTAAPTTSAAPPTTVPSTTAAPTTTVAPTTTTTISTTTTTTTTTPATTTTAPEDVVDEANQSPREAVIQGGVVYLRGAVPSAEFGAQIVAAVEQIVGPGNVVDEYTVDPAAPEQVASPVRVADLILFDYNSAVLRPEFQPLVQLGVNLLTVSPTAVLTVLGYTDTIGPADSNLRLSQRRVDAVVAALVAGGADPDRIVGVARGEEAPIVDDGDVGAPENRRIEFVVEGLLG